MTVNEAVWTAEATWTPPDDLRDIVEWLEPGAAGERVVELASRLSTIAACFLIEQDAATDHRSARKERQRYDAIAAAARALRLALADRAAPGVLLGPLARLRSEGHADKATANALPSSADIAYGICSWPQGHHAHPLCLIEKIAEKAAADLATETAKAGAATLHVRMRGHPLTALALACARLLHELTREPPKIGEAGQLADLVERVWKDATGMAVPPRLRYHAREGAAALRAELDAPGGVGSELVENVHDLLPKCTNVRKM